MHQHLSGKQRHRREKNIETNLKMAVNFRVLMRDGRMNFLTTFVKNEPLVEISPLVSQLAMDYSLMYYVTIICFVKHCKLLNLIYILRKPYHLLTCLLIRKPDQMQEGYLLLVCLRTTNFQRKR